MSNITFILLYASLVRPHLDYASSICVHIKLVTQKKWKKF